MTCPTCKNEKAFELRYFTHNGKDIVQCNYCPNHVEPPSRNQWGVNAGSFANSSSGKMSAAHYDDISRRRVCPEDGRSVYRDRGAKSIIVNGLK